MKKDGFQIMTILESEEETEEEIETSFGDEKGGKHSPNLKKLHKNR